MNRKIAFLVIFIFLIFLCSSCFAYTENTTSGNSALFTFTYSEDLTLNDLVNVVFDHGDTNYYTISEIQNSSWVFFYNPCGYYELTFDIQSIGLAR